MKIMEIGEFDDFTCTVLALFALAIVVQFVYYLLVYLRVVLYAEKQT
jgi:hypothetical protein